MEHWNGIGKLVEECGEVLQLAGKAIPFPVGPHPDGQGEIKDRITLELADLIAAASYFIQTNGLDIDAIEERSKVKLQRFIDWKLSGIKA